MKILMKKNKVNKKRQNTDREIKSNIVKKKSSNDQRCHHKSYYNFYIWFNNSKSDMLYHVFVGEPAKSKTGESDW